MNWAEKKIEEYKKGKESTWFERRILEHANPVHFVLAVVGMIIGLYGLWLHDWTMVAIGMGLNLLGHMYTWFSRK